MPTTELQLQRDRLDSKPKETGYTLSPQKTPAVALWEWSILAKCKKKKKKSEFRGRMQQGMASTLGVLLLSNCSRLKTKLLCLEFKTIYNLAASQPPLTPPSLASMYYLKDLALASL